MSKYVKEVNSCLLEIKNGNIREFERLYALTANHLKAVAIIYLYNKQNCDDVLTDVYVKVLKYIEKFNENMDGYNWLCRCVQNMSYNYNIRDAAYREYNEANQVTGFSERWDEIDSAMDIRSAIRQLSKVERYLLFLKYEMDLSFREIATILNCSKSEVNRKHKIILKKLSRLRSLI